MKIYAIIPARSGSKGAPDKNIRKIDGMELIGYSIEFAKSLGCMDQIICSTDSDDYARIAKKFGAEVPFLRSDKASADNAMEEDILVDLNDCFERAGMEKPDLLVWLRPTFLFRDKDLVKKCINRLKEDDLLTACRLVCEAEGRLYRDAHGCLEPTFEDHGASMARRQDMGSNYRVYNTDVFRFPKSKDQVSKDFLGRKIGFEVANKICALDIDDESDFELVESIVVNSRDLVSDYLF